MNKSNYIFRFIAFGRGKSIPLTPDSTNIELPSEISNTGRIVVNKCIDKIELEKREAMLQAEKDLLLSHRNHHSQYIDKNGKILERRKKGRLYSLGGNEPQRKGHRGRLDRLKTVGTFDLGTEMSVLSQVARNLNEQLISGELAMLPLDGNRTSVLTTPSFHSSVHTSARNTPELRKREIGRRTPLRSPLMHDSRVGVVEFRGQHSADDCIQTSSPTITNVPKKPRSLSTSSYIKDRLSAEAAPFEIRPLHIGSSEIRKMETDKTSSTNSETEKDSKKIEEDVVSAEHTGKRDFSKDFSYRSRKSMLRKSKRIVRTDSEIFKEGIIDRNEYILRNNCDIQIHANQDNENEDGEARDVLGAENCRTSSVASSSVHSRKDSSEIDDICSPKDRQKSTDESSKNISTDDMDAVFSDSNTDLEKLEREYKELIKTNLQREYKSDGDTLDEVGKKRNEFGKWKNQSLEHEFEYSNQELMNIIGDQTLSSHSYCTSTDTKDMSRICSPESYATGAYSDSGVKGLDEKYSTYAKMRSRVYSSSRLGETPTERERLYPIRNNARGNFVVPIAGVASTASENTIVDSSSISKVSSLIRPSKLDINSSPRPKSSHENPIQSLFEKPFGKFKRVNKLLKCKRFSASTLYDKKKPPQTDEVKNSPKLFERFTGKENSKGNGLTETKSAINLSKLSLFNQKPGKASTFWGRKSGMFSAASHSNNELFSKSGSKTKLSEVSKSNTELSKYKTSPLKSSKKKGSRYEKNNTATCLPANICHSPLSEEFYNKTGSVRLSAMELYEKFCSEDFSGLYKNENSRSYDRRDMHEYRLEQKGLRVIGRYNKNARLLKQRSEPKFNLRGTPGGSSYYHEEDEYYYDHRGAHAYGYYNEQDEYYNEYEDEDVEDIEGDYYEDDEEGDYYDEVEPDDPELAMEESPHFIDKDDQNELEFQFQNCGATCLELSRADCKKTLEAASTGTDSDVDEIYLMPAEGKCIDEDEYGFENKQFSLEHSMLTRSNGKERTGFLQDAEMKKSGDEENLPPNVDSLLKNHADDVLTIYRMCSKEEIMKISDSEAEGREKQESKKQRSTSLQSESLEKAVKEYIKYATSDMSVEPSVMKTDCTSIDRTDSLELLSNSSGTMRSRSTLTEYAFDTVRNMNLDSCSTSKLSLSLKSEVFDDFTITPDDLKTIQNCEIEDFTLTPDGSIGDSTTETGNNTKLPFVESDKDGEEGRNSMIEDECPSKVLVIVDKFLENERNNLHRQMSIDEPTTSSRSQNNQSKSRGEVLETSFDEEFGSAECSEAQVKEDTTSMTNEIKQEAPEEDSKECQHHHEDSEDCAESCKDTAEDTSTKASDSFHTPNAEQESTTSNEYTVIDLYDDGDGHAVSLFTSELTKEFDRLFSQAEQFDQDFEEEGGPTPTDDIDLTTNDRPQIPSRYSMQKLEPYYIADPVDEDTSQASSQPKTNTPVANNVKPVEISQSNNNTSSSSSGHHNNKVVTSSRLKKIRSQSLGNLNKKTKCFPL